MKVTYHTIISVTDVINMLNYLCSLQNIIKHLFKFIILKLQCMRIITIHHGLC